MNNISKALILLILIELVFSKCANIGTPSGGPRDSIPPLLLNSYPLNGQVNFTENEFRLEFSEFIKADKIQQQLIITPKVNNKFKTIAKRNILILRFQEPFQDSTTYNLNFADAVTDVTENNPAINLSIAFSTGSYIDSLSIQGSVVDLFTQEKVKGYLVGLYPFTDTLDYFTDNPLYFSTVNDSGNFRIDYIKSDVYKLVVYNDENSNILLDPETEPHGFINDSIILDSSITIVKPIQTINQNVKPIQFINSRSTGPYIELKFNKTISDYQITPTSFKSNLVGENKESIRIYKTPTTINGDTIQIISNASDSLGNSTVDTVRTAFIESNRKPSSFSMNLSSQSKYLEDNSTFKVKFNKPITYFDSTRISFIKDSVFNYQIKPKLFWNENRTQLTLQTSSERAIVLDSITKSIKKYNSKIDSLDTINIIPIREDFEIIQFQLDSGAFISVENDTSHLKTIVIQLNEKNEYGTIKLSITTLYQSFNVQLINNKEEVEHNAWNSDKITFPKVTPGKYTIRVLIDNNQDGVWSPGNLLKNEVPEDIYIHTEETSIRENWVLEIDISF